MAVPEPDAHAADLGGQGAVSAVCTAIGIVLGTAAAWLLQRALRRFGRPVSVPVRRQMWRAMAVIGGVLGSVGLLVWPRWQSDQRELVELGPISAATVVPMALLTLVLLVILMMLGRLVWKLVRATDRWTSRVIPRRPKLVVFGQSLGSFGGEAPFAGVDARSSVANLVARTDGALFTGPTNDNTIWSQITGARDDGSPVWRPVYDGGVSVRFSNQPEDLLEDDPGWESPRILYVQHPSDPVTFWSADSLWSSPEWVDDPTGYDVPSRVSWFPIVTGVQGVADLAAGFGAPPGFGHDYRLAFVASWAAIVPPVGWTAEDTKQLQDLLHE